MIQIAQANRRIQKLMAKHFGPEKPKPEAKNQKQKTRHTPSDQNQPFTPSTLHKAKP